MGERSRGAGVEGEIEREERRVMGLRRGEFGKVSGKVARGLGREGWEVF